MRTVLMKLTDRLRPDWVRCVGVYGEVGSVPPSLFAAAIATAQSQGWLILCQHDDDASNTWRDESGEKFIVTKEGILNDKKQLIAQWRWGSEENRWGFFTES